MPRYVIYAITVFTSLVAAAIGWQAFAQSERQEPRIAMEHAFRQGLDAYHAGDFRRALQTWLPSARYGNAKAQSSIGHLYFKGLGVPQSDSKARTWYGMAAVQGEPTAQYRMGLIYLRGNAGVRNPGEAYMWCTLAMEAGYPEAFYCREEAGKHLSPAEMDNAERRGRNMIAGPRS